VNAIEVAQRHFDAWNRHDADAIVADFAEGGTYNNPIAGQGLTGAAIGSFAKGLFAAYPDASFELISIGDTGRGLVAFQWLARATNTGPVRTVRRLRVAVLGCRARPSFRWMATKFARRTSIMTGRLWLSSWALRQPNPPRSRNRHVVALSTISPSNQ
jgi:hypothetical protein